MHNIFCLYNFLSSENVPTISDRSSFTSSSKFIELLAAWTSVNSSFGNSSMITAVNISKGLYKYEIQNKNLLYLWQYGSGGTKGYLARSNLPMQIVLALGVGSMGLEHKLEFVVAETQGASIVHTWPRGQYLS